MARAACNEITALVRLSVRSLWLPHWIYRGVDLWVPSGELAVMVGDQTGVEVLRVVEGCVIPMHGDVAVDDEALGFASPSARRRLGVEVVTEKVAPSDGTVREALACVEAEAVDAQARPAAEVLSLLPRLVPVLDVRTEDLQPTESAALSVGLTLVRRPRVLLAAGLAQRMSEDGYLDVLTALRSVADTNGMAVLLAEVGGVPEDRFDSVYVVHRGRIWRRPTPGRNDAHGDVDEGWTKGEDMRAEDVAARLLEVGGPMSPRRLHTLLYYVHARYLVLFGSPPMRIQWEAWSDGPVAPRVYAQHGGRLSVSAGLVTAGRQRVQLARAAESVVDDVLSAAASLDDEELRRWVSEAGPWRRARARRDRVSPADVAPERWYVDDDQTGSPRITAEDMATMHSDLVLDRPPGA